LSLSLDSNNQVVGGGTGAEGCNLMQISYTRSHVQYIEWYFSSKNHFSFSFYI